ncbi:MAG: type IV secretory system conjugative DNA transfer family protein [Oscillospiraceae bacterium]|nr:type IV secretory system conjugative DNA transfer family protein [Oscillospiraceae bacterium]
MNFIKGPIPPIPPIIILHGGWVSVCYTDYDIKLRLNPKTMRRSNTFIIHDPDGRLLKRHGKTFRRNRYNVKVLNLADIRISTRYSPILNIKGNSGITNLAAAIIAGTKGLGMPGDIDFITHETLLLTSLIGFLHYEVQSFEQTFSSILMLLESMKTEDDWHDYKTAVDFMFEAIAEENTPEHYAVQKLKDFKEAAGHEAQQKVIASCISRLSPFSTAEMVDFMSDDELVLDRLTFPNIALFVIDGEADEQIRFLTPLMYSQLFDLRDRRDA